MAEHVTCGYRVWDLQITDIDAVPMPNAKQGGSIPWRWKSHLQGRAWPIVEALLGLLVACWAIVKLARKPASEASACLTARQLPNKWAARI